MADKGKREPKHRAGPGTLVDLNLWDVLLGLMEPAETPEHDPKPSEAVPARVSEAERDELAGAVRAAGMKASRGSRRKQRRENGSGSEG
jgi:hypothetical protein